MGRAAQFLNSCHFWVCTGVHRCALTQPFRLERTREGEPDPTHTNSKTPREKLQKNFGSLRVFFLHLQLTHAPPSQNGPEPSLELPSTTVTKKIKKHFLSESRQGGDPAVSSHAEGAGTCPALRPHPPQQRPVPQPSSAGQAKGTKKPAATQPWLSRISR